MTKIPDALPFISGGGHANPAEGACIMEYVSMLAGEEFSDRPSCTHPLLAAAARVTNDALSDAERQALVPLVGRFFGTSTNIVPNLNMNLAMWATRTALKTLDPDHAGLVRKFNEVVDAAVARQPAKAERLLRETGYAYALTHGHLTVMMESLIKLGQMPRSYSAGEGVLANAPLVAMANTRADRRGEFMIDMLKGLLDEFDRLTGRKRDEVREVGTAELLTLMADALA